MSEGGLGESFLSGSQSLPCLEVGVTGCGSFQKKTESAGRKEGVFIFYTSALGGGVFQVRREGLGRLAPGTAVGWRGRLRRGGEGGVPWEGFAEWEGK